MNKYTSQKLSKRVPGQYHLKLFFAATYNGVPVINCPDGLVEQYLSKTYRIIQGALQKHSKIFAVRVDLHFPQYYSPLDHELLSHHYHSSFIKRLNRRLQQYKRDKEEMGIRVHDVGFAYVWAREIGSESNKPHFHLLLLFNGHAFNTLGQFSEECESLYNRIGEAWGKTLGLQHHSEGVKFVHFAVNGQYNMQADCWEDFAEVFYRTSYLVKMATKSFKDGCHVFGGSRGAGRK